ncbi:MAG: cell division protein FtsQ/DivIB [Hydrotalea sp.]|nr:cell division protein FtsQ/DivIB [Hydrotalea sp.]
MKHSWRQIVTHITWAFVGLGILVLAGLAFKEKKSKTCQDILIQIGGTEGVFFLNEQDIRALLEGMGAREGVDVVKMDLQAMEEQLRKNPWIHTADLYMNNMHQLHVHIIERNPMVRLMDLQGNSFYVDESGQRLPLSQERVARVPVITGFPQVSEKLAQADSILMEQVLRLVQYISADSFWVAQVAQVHIHAKGEFEMWTVLGDERILLGSTLHLEQKFSNLFTFYKQAWLKGGWNQYKEIDLRFKNQVVARKKSEASDFLQTPLNTEESFIDSASKNQMTIPNKEIEKRFTPSNNKTSKVGVPNRLKTSNSNSMPPKAVMQKKRSE